MATRERARLGGETDGDLRFESEPAPDLIGEVIDGRYRVADLLGTGGMARVFRAEQLRLQRPVAIKVLHAGFGKIPEVCRRFEREAIAIARLDHPNCVTIFDSGQLYDGSLYLVMQLLQGTLLTDALAARAFDPRRALHVARHIASGLAHAHRAGIVHRDIKTDNIMLVPHVGDADFATILDFGIAKLMEPDEGEPPSHQLTLAGQRFGTPAYMSPEQALGSPIDERTDLYSTCVVLFEMLTGRRPFEADDDATVLAMQASKAPPSLADRAPAADLPEELEELVARGLTKDPDDRYASAGELIVAIDECTEALYPGPVRAPASTARVLPAVPPAQRWWTRRRIAAAAGAGVLAIAALALFGASEKDHAGRAARLLADGKPEEAISYLEQRADDVADDAGAQLQLGHAYAAVRRHAEALRAYRRALDEQSSLESNETLRTNLRLMLDDARSEAATGAATLLVQQLEDPEGREQLARVASRHRDAEHRAQMRELADQLGVGDAIDRVESYRLDLVQGKSCDARRSAIARLRALGNRDAIPALAKARKRKRNRCVRADADEAIQYLRAAN